MINKGKDQFKLYIQILDLLCLCLSFFAAMWIRFGVINIQLYGTLYGVLLLLLALCHICIYNVHDFYYGFYKRGFYDEFVNVFKINLAVALLISGILFFLQAGSLYSRYFLASLLLINILVDYIARQYFKILSMSYYKRSRTGISLFIITTADQVKSIVHKMLANRDWQSHITGIAVIDKNMVGQEIEGIPVVSDKVNLVDVITKSAVDEVFISVRHSDHFNLDELLNDLESIGLTINLSLSNYDFNLRARAINNIYGYNVLTFEHRVFNKGALLLKRTEDIVGSMIGIIITVIVGLFVVPAILIESPGPFIFSQTRVGKNGRRFKIYKFRSMYMDAEKRKKELMQHNEMHGLMFKMKNDPRVTKIGKFIRKTSIDELPQFFNVLMGDMSLVGTRPPTEDEFLQYESRFKKRLIMRPGITGLWQVSGRNRVNDFEDVLKFDMTFINNWNIMLDIKILIKTLVWVLLRLGAE
jgi:exopolysaccharide biosynthesis polyprenyl glycosylphosphotransferase